MKGKLALVILAVVSATAGALYLRTRVDARPLVGAITCEDKSISYRVGETRVDDDGCNACTCGSTGWSCSKFACGGSVKAVGVITGKLTYPAERVPSLQVCAEDGPKKIHYCVQTATGATEYALAVPEGRYYVYASSPADPSKKAYYSEFVDCGLKPDCPSHSPREVTASGIVMAAADPIDWQSAGSVDSVSVTPAQYLDKTFFYMDGAVFNLSGRGFQAVEVLAAPVVGDAAIHLGSASSTVDEKGYGHWTVSIPPGFEAVDVFAVTTDVEGKTMRTFGTGRVKPWSTLQ